MDQYLRIWHGIVGNSDLAFERNSKERIQIYTDGSCFANTATESATGLGVYFGPNHPLHLSVPCTNRNAYSGAELEAILQAIQIIKQLNLINIDIHTDSEFLCNSLNLWYEHWRGRNWLASTGNQSRIRRKLFT